MKALLLLSVVACTQETDRRTPITTENQLGVVAMQVDRFDDQNARVFELRGFDQTGSEVALVRLRIGDIAGIGTGSELFVSTAGHDAQRWTSTQTQLFSILPNDPATDEFVALAPVAAALEREHIIALGHDEAPVERPYLTVSCPRNYLNTSPWAYECCYDYGSGTGGYMIFRNGATTVTNRLGPKTPCTGYNNATCSGSACVYGPNGFSVANNGNYRPYIFTDASGHCNTGGPTFTFGTVSGLFPTGCGCCGNATRTVCASNTSSQCYAYGYPLCSTCSGGGHFDY